MFVIEIPKRLEALLNQDRGLHGAVLSNLSRFEPWLRSSGTPFFPEYTDHSPQHVTDVLGTAGSLINDAAWQIIRPPNAAVLILAVLLHDSAMHLSEDGFLALVRSESYNPAASADTPWTKLWQDFLSEASRFDARRLVSIFGEAEPVHAPGPNPANWTKTDRLLIGEFLRRYHARLAHEFAVNGVPGPGKAALRLEGMPAYTYQLAGIVARSHGYPLRLCIDLLGPYDRRDFRGIYAPFLMAVLRVSDYLQIHAERAPSALMHIRTLRSPISEGEWKAHHAVLDIRNTHDDPEAVFVQAAPQDVKTYLKLKTILTGLQAELDASWSVLGETYGRIGPLANLGLAIRRVRSNMDDEGQFAASVSFFPVRAAFDASPDLLKLLIAPLYGNKPEIGIRELMQNAVDACLELEDLRTHSPDFNPPDLTDQAADVVITAEAVSVEEHYVTISDRGVGMTVDTILNYFLKAGASFRRSDTWRAQHEAEPGKSRLNRSGRFGIGVLAAFLLGDQISVTTRHINSPPDAGIAFSAGLESAEIELARHTRPVGTTVRVRVNDDKVWNKITTSPSLWDWFCLSGPRVQRRVVTNSKDFEPKQSYSFGQAVQPLSSTWRRTSHPNFRDIQWTYSAKVPALVCNGIKIIDPVNSYDHQRPVADLYRWSGRILSAPSLSVFDPDGHLPLVLQRTSLGDRLPFEDALRGDVLRDLIAFALLNAPTQTLAGHIDSYAVWYPGTRGAIWQPARWLMFSSVKDGTVVSDSALLQRCKIQSLLLSPAWPHPIPAALDNHVDLMAAFAFDTKSESYMRTWFRFAMGLGTSSNFGAFEHLGVKSRRILIGRSLLRELRLPGKIDRSIWRNSHEEWSNHEWTVLATGGPAGRFSFQALVESGVAHGYEGLTEWNIGNQAVPFERSAVATAWDNLVGPDVVIPYDVKERRQVFRNAFESLAHEIRAWESVAKA